MNYFHYILKENAIYALAEQLCKNKATKREITDVAISKVPYVIYPDLDENESLIIHELAEHCLRTARTQNNHNEVMITYNLENHFQIKDGFHPILEAAGVFLGEEAETEVYCDAKSASVLWRAKSVAVVSIHNHPSCSTFSVEDISLFLFETTIKLMVVVGNNGELYYLSKNLEKYDSRKAFSLFNEIACSIHPEGKDAEYSYSEMRLVADLFLKKSYGLGLEYRHVLGNNVELQERKEKGEKDYDDR